MPFQVREYQADDGVALRYREWSGESHPDALVYLHGIESHSEWFSECAEKVAGMGVAVYAPDRRGSGMNAERRGHCGDFRQLVNDVVRCVRAVASPHRSVHAAALSWGAKLAVAVDMLHPGFFSTITLISPGIFPRVMPGIGERFAIAFDALFRPHALHPIPIKDEMFTSLPRSLEYIANDLLRLRKVTARFYLESVRLDRFLRKREYQWTAPTQALLAEHDAIVDNARTQKMFESLKTEPKKVTIYAGCNHSLQFEKPGEVARDIVNWMQMGTTGQPGRSPAGDDV